MSDMQATIDELNRQRREARIDLIDELKPMIAGERSEELLRLDIDWAARAIAALKAANLVAESTSKQLRALERVLEAKRRNGCHRCGVDAHGIELARLRLFGGFHAVLCCACTSEWHELSLASVERAQLVEVERDASIAVGNHLDARTKTYELHEIGRAAFSLGRDFVKAGRL